MSFTYEHVEPGMERGPDPRDLATFDGENVHAWTPGRFERPPILVTGRALVGTRFPLTVYDFDKRVPKNMTGKVYAKPGLMS